MSEAFIVHPQSAPTPARRPHGYWGSNSGVADGTRTHDDQNHNLGLYQLSYSHRKPLIIARIPPFDQLPVAVAGAGRAGSIFTLKRVLRNS